jgi:hypothetical protein
LAANENIFAEAVGKAVTPEFRANRWLVYDRYEWQPFKGERGRWDAYAVVPHKKAGRSATFAVVRSTNSYAPLIDTPDLFKRFADLADGEITQDVWKGWIADYGTLGLQKEVNPSRGGPAESFSAFVQEASGAADLLRLYEAAADPTVVDQAYIREYLYPEQVPEGVSAARDAALFLVDVGVQEKLEKECFPLFHRKRDGMALLSHGFRSLLGAMYLQMAFLRSGTTAARVCQGPGCNRTIDLSAPETEKEKDKRLARGERKVSKTYDNKKYHSKACKQAAYRARKKGTPPDSDWD